MKDEHKLVIVGIVAALGIYGLNYVLKPFLPAQGTSFEWLAREAPKVAILIAFGLVAQRIIARRSREAVDSAKAKEVLALQQRISTTFLIAPGDKVYQQVLSIILEATASKHGIFGYINEQGDLVCPSLVGAAWDKCQIPGKSIVFRSTAWGGLWGRALTERELVCSNRPFNLPQGHVPVGRAMAVPIVHRHRLVGLVMVGDKATDYDKQDCQLLKDLARHISPILSGMVPHSADPSSPRESGAERQRKQVRLLREQKASEIGSLAGAVARNFSALLSTLASASGEVRRGVTPCSRLEEELAQVQTTGIGAINLTRQSLFLNQEHPMNAAAVDLNAVVHEICTSLGNLLGKGISTNASLDPSLWPLRADRGTLELVIMNMAINAREAMPSGGTLGIRTENVGLARGQWELIPEARPGNFVCVSISDDGLGMDKETIRYIFEPYFTTKSSGRNIGLGLSVARGIIKQHDGWINVYSEPGRGSTLKIYLPALPAEVAAQDQPAAPEIPAAGRGEHILVVEDEGEIRELVSTVLSDNGYAVSTAESANEALNVFQKTNGEIDILFSDVVLPGEDGIKLADRLVSLRPSLPVLLTSGYMDEEKEWVITCEKGFRFLHKPFSIAEMLRTVRNMLDEGQAAQQGAGAGQHAHEKVTAGAE
jgi:signal transduction histidine kinase/FixJ family two-component response regulator